MDANVADADDDTPSSTTNQESLPYQPYDAEWSRLDARWLNLVYEESFGYRPYDWQLDIGIHLLKMLYNHNGLQPDACFLSAVTGGGKSSV